MKNGTVRLIFLALCASMEVNADPVVLKVATLAPEGSAWMRLSHEWQKSVEARTEGRVKTKFYAGGVQGDERDVLRKVRLGQLSGAAITTIGLASIDQEVRALEVARTYEELDYARKGLGALLKRKFDDKGFILLGWGDVGPVHLFSNRPVKSAADLQALKLWRWADDPITSKLFAALEVRGVPLGIPDVLPALSTGTIDAFFSAPLPTLALQWASHAKYVTSMVMGQAIGATVIAKAVWAKISPADQKIMLEESLKLEQKAIAQIRGDNAKALEALRQKGLQVVDTPKEFELDLRRRAEPIALAAGASFSKEFQDTVRHMLDQYRSKNK